MGGLGGWKSEGETMRMSVQRDVMEMVLGLVAAATFGCGGHVDVSCGARTHLVNDQCIPDEDGGSVSVPPAGDAASTPPSEDAGGLTTDSGLWSSDAGQSIDAMFAGGDGSTADATAAPDGGKDAGGVRPDAAGDAGSTYVDASDDGGITPDATADSAASSADANEDTAVPCADINACLSAVPIDGGTASGGLNWCDPTFDGFSISGIQSEWVELKLTPDCLSNPADFGFTITLESPSPSSKFDLEVYEAPDTYTPGTCPALTATDVAVPNGAGGFVATAGYASPASPVVYLHVVAEAGAACAAGTPWGLTFGPYF